MKKKLISFMLIALFLLMLIPSSLMAADTYADEELARAVELGFGGYRTDNHEVSYAEFMKMLDRTLELADKNKLADWKKQLPEARKSTKTMTRFHGEMAIIYAAATLGGEYCEIPHFIWDSDFLRAGDHDGMEKLEKIAWEDLYSIIPNIDNKSFHSLSPDQDWSKNDYDTMAQWYAFGRISYFSGKPIFEFDEKRFSMRLADPLTYQEAMLAALRLYDSPMREVIERVPTDADAEILKKADERKMEILKTPTDVTVKGKKYYISNKGNDSNDGLTPKTAKATLENFPYNILKPGDGVFFERSGIWRGRISCVNGVIFSAYGEGEKPKIIGSPESGADPKKWKLWYDKNGVKIWQFYKDINECGNIVFNDGASYAVRRLSYWNGKQNVFPDNKNKKFDIVEGLKCDLTFYSTFSDSEISRLPVNDGDAGMLKGPVYLRCDKGNPGSLYKSVEFQSFATDNDNTCLIHAFAGKDNITIDNLCLMYSSLGGINGGDNNILLQNCEIAWCGGTQFMIDPDIKDIEIDGWAWWSGDSSKDMTVQNCYFHDIGGNGVAFELSPGSSLEKINISNNIFERCMGSISIGGWEDNSFTIKNIVISNNYILYDGYSFGYDILELAFGNNIKKYSFYPFTSSVNLGPVKYENENVSITDNIFYLAKYALVSIPFGKKNIHLFSGNTYIQNTNGVIVNPYMENLYSWRYPLGGEKFALNDTQMEDVIKNVIGDKTAIILPLN